MPSETELALKFLEIIAILLPLTGVYAQVVTRSVVGHTSKEVERWAAAGLLSSVLFLILSALSALAVLDPTGHMFFMQTLGWYLPPWRVATVTLLSLGLMWLVYPTLALVQAQTDLFSLILPAEDITERPTKVDVDRGGDDGD